MFYVYGEMPGFLKYEASVVFVDIRSMRIERRNKKTKEARYTNRIRCQS